VIPEEENFPLNAQRMGIFDRQIIETIFCTKNNEGKPTLLPIEEIAKKCTRLHPESAELYD
jgi:hypothetical protein